MRYTASTFLTTALILATAPWAPCDAAVKTILHSFQGTPDGSRPETVLLRDTSGALYGTAVYGGGTDNGVVFKLLPPASGTAWTYQVLHEFAGGLDGCNPHGPLVRRGTGVLYGAASNCGGSNTGLIYKLAPPPGGGSTTWTKTTIWDFDYNLRPTSPRNPMAGLIADTPGNLYGTSYNGGKLGYGTVFQVSPPPAGKTDWSVSILNSLAMSPGGGYPNADLTRATDGTLYTTATNGGTHYDGTAFALKPPAAGKTAWTKTVLYNFGGPKARKPFGGLTPGPGGVFYGTTYYGGAADAGTVFKLTPPAAGKTVWTETDLYAFKGGGDGASPFTGVVRAPNGALYGTTSAGGTADHGIVFKLTPPAPGKTLWTKSEVYRFKGGGDGSKPYAKLVVDPSGTLYGSTTEGGKYGKGTIFKLVP